MSCAILAIGTELVRGEIFDTNSRWISSQLTALGFEVTELASVDDDEDRIASTLRRLGDVHEVVVTTGGLGPTSDDLTTQAVATAARVALYRDEPSVEAIRRRFQMVGRTMSETNLKQADFPVGAEVLPNDRGTAPGFTLGIGRARLFVLPGVPHEMEAMFRQQVAPRVTPLAPRNTCQLRLQTFGLPESQVQERLADLEEKLPDVTIGYRLRFPEIEVKLLARADDYAAAEQLAQRALEEARRRLGESAFGHDDDTLSAAVGRALRERGLTIALGESCTGGLVGALLTSVPGSSDYLLLDAVTYSNGSKEKVLGVRNELLRAHGAVSEEVASAMAEGVRRLSGADYAVSITGIAGPGGATDGKPVGTVWWAIATEHGTVTMHRRLVGDRERIQRLAAHIALDMVRRSVLGLAPPSDGVVPADGAR
ncbi:MAG: competence/damage-inducible protein A [Deltaproteobacteria bacterium]|nr:competence/damage-inducible protein A [Deltaproteobacteria bacterium]